MSNGLTYRAAGVNIDAGNELAQRIAPACRATHIFNWLQQAGGIEETEKPPALLQARKDR